MDDSLHNNYFNFIKKNSKEFIKNILTFKIVDYSGCSRH